MSYERTDAATQQRARRVRWGVLGAALVTITVLVTAHQYVSGSGKPVGVDALCPFGGVETIYTLISGAGFIDKTAASAVVLLIGSVLLALFMRRSFCGQLCPLGALQGMFGSLGRRLFGKKRPRVPLAVDRVARYLKYAVLAVFAVWTWRAATLVMRPYDPWVAYTHLTSEELLVEFGVGLAVLVVALAGSVVYERFFCKYLCPTGALLSVFSKFSLFGIRRDAESCIDCGRCDRACSMNVPVSGTERVTSPECISCNECVNACPVAGALTIERRGGTRTSPLAITGAVVAILAVFIGASTAAGYFDWKTPSLGEAIQQSGGADPAASGGFDTSLIKGYMSLAEIAEATGIPAAEFSERYGVPASDLGKPMKDIKETYDFTPEDVKAWVDARLDQ